MSCLYSIIYPGNNEPPEGFPRMLVRSEDRHEVEQLLLWAKLVDFNYSLGIEVQPANFKRHLSQQALAKMRMKRLEKRLRTKYGLFYDDFLKQELNKRPSYFAGKRGLQEEDEVDEGGEIMDVEQAKTFLLHRMPFISEHINKLTEFHNRKKAGEKLSFLTFMGIRRAKIRMDAMLDKERQNKKVKQEIDSLWLPFDGQ